MWKQIRRLTSSHGPGCRSSTPRLVRVAAAANIAAELEVQSLQLAPLPACRRASVPVQVSVVLIHQMAVDVDVDRCELAGCRLARCNWEVGHGIRDRGAVRGLDRSDGFRVGYVRSGIIGASGEPGEDAIGIGNPCASARPAGRVVVAKLMAGTGVGAQRPVERHNCRSRRGY